MKGHFLLLAELRWQIFRNSLRLRRKKWELAARVLVALMGGAVALVFGLGFWFLVHRGVTRGAAAPLAVVLWAIFLAWQLAPLLMEGFSPALNFREIARYPVSFRLYYFLDLVYGLLDPVALACLLWLFFAWLGILTARPEWAARAALLLTVFALVNLALNRVFFGFIERLLRTRRGREALLAFLMVLAVLSQILFYGVFPRLKKASLERLATQAAVVHRVSPPGLVVAGVVWPPRSRGRAPLAPSLFGLAAYAAGGALLMRRQLWRKFRGETVSEVALPAGAVQVQPGWQISFMSPAWSAILEKELRYALRDPRAILGFVSAPIMGGIAAVSTEVARKAVETGLKISSDNIYPGLLGYALLALGALAFNSFCYESHGLQRWLMAPVELRRVFVAKNLVVGILLGGNFLILTVLARPWRNLPAGQAVIVGLGYLFACLTLLAVGNLFSVWYPNGIEYGTMSTKRVSEMAVLLGMLTQLAVLGLVASVLYLSARWKLAVLPAPAFLLLCLAAARFYLYSLDAAPRYLLAHAEEISAQLAT